MTQKSEARGLDLEKLFTQAEDAGVTAITEAIKLVKQHHSKAVQEAQAACKAYFDEVEQREAKVKQRVADLTKQENDIKAKIAAMQPGLVDATVSGDTDAFDRMQDALADLEARRTAVAAQIQMLSEAAIPGNPDLYRAAIAKIEAMSKNNEQCENEIVAIRGFADRQSESWERIYDDLRYTRFSTSGAALPKEQIELEKHFRSQDRRSIAPSLDSKTTDNCVKRGK